jgi:hypothetical protein
MKFSWPRRKWHVQKYDPRTGRAIPTNSLESERMFWTETGATREEIRLNQWLMTTRLPHRFRTVKIYKNCRPI